MHSPTTICARGEIYDLFFNTPVRDQMELIRITEFVHVWLQFAPLIEMQVSFVAYVRARDQAHFSLANLGIAREWNHIDLTQRVPHRSPARAEEPVGVLSSATQKALHRRRQRAARELGMAPDSPAKLSPRKKWGPVLPLDSASIRFGQRGVCVYLVSRYVLLCVIAGLMQARAVCGVRRRANRRLFDP